MEPPVSHNVYDFIKDIVIPLFGATLSFIAVFIAIRTLKATLKVAQANYEFQMTVSHRDTWRYILDRKLVRIKDESADPGEMSEEELLNINFILINVKNSFDARKKGILSKGQDEYLFMKDVGEFFSFPLPNTVWQRMKKFYDPDFHKFMENSIKIHLIENAHQPSA